MPIVGRKHVQWSPGITFVMLGLAAVISLVCGCFSQFFPIHVVDTKEGVAFELPEMADGLSSKHRYELLDLRVTTRGCSSYCTFWDIARPLESGTVYLDRARIVYGTPVPGTVARTPAQSLSAARYTVAATVQEYGSRGELVRSLSMRKEFDVYQDDAGKLRVADDKPGKTGGCQ
jgi:hypothetical protein